jgi:hypothetical protein
MIAISTTCLIFGNSEFCLRIVFYGLSAIFGMDRDYFSKQYLLVYICNRGVFFEARTKFLSVI